MIHATQPTKRRNVYDFIEREELIRLKRALHEFLKAAQDYHDAHVAAKLPTCDRICNCMSRAELALFGEVDQTVNPFVKDWKEPNEHTTK